jgi:hypothetical protein
LGCIGSCFGPGIARGLITVILFSSRANSKFLILSSFVYALNGVRAFGLFNLLSSTIFLFLLMMVYFVLV